MFGRCSEPIPGVLRGFVRRLRLIARFDGKNACPPGITLAVILAAATSSSFTRASSLTSSQFATSSPPSAVAR